MEPAGPGSLTVVGTGIQLGTHLTPEARAVIGSADVVFTLVTEPVMLAAVGRLNKETRPLQNHYVLGESRSVAYEAMVEDILANVRKGLKVCAAFYGHPGVFVYPAGRAIARARELGIGARMLPAVSALDCLFADLGVDPAANGCQLYEAGDFVRRGPALETAAALVLWQVGVVELRGELVAALRRSYGPAHELVVYEASPYPGIGPAVERMTVDALGAAELSQRSTVYVPPQAAP